MWKKRCIYFCVNIEKKIIAVGKKDDLSIFLNFMSWAILHEAFEDFLLLFQFSSVIQITTIEREHCLVVRIMGYHDALINSGI